MERNYDENEQVNGQGKFSNLVEKLGDEVIKIRQSIDHYTNSGHVYCFGVKLGLERKTALSIARYYEKFVGKPYKKFAHCQRGSLILSQDQN
jgi:hypothetical protein